MENEIRFLGKRILERKYEIAQIVNKSRSADIEKLNLDMTDEEIIEVRARFVSCFGEVMQAGMDRQTAYEYIYKWGKETGEFIYGLGISLDEALKDTSHYRETLWNVIKEEVKHNNLSLDTVFEVGAVLDPLMDQAVYSFSLTYVNYHRETLERAKDAFMELSIPVVPIAKAAAILPLIGNVDTERANCLLEETLRKAADLKLSILFFDLSGVVIVDTMVAHRILRVIEALSLLGVKTVLTGIRPEVAQTLVQLGVDLSGLNIKGTLQQALTELNSNISGF